MKQLCYLKKIMNPIKVRAFVSYKVLTSQIQYFPHVSPWWGL